MLLPTTKDEAVLLIRRNDLCLGLRLLAPFVLLANRFLFLGLQRRGDEQARSANAHTVKSFLMLNCFRICSGVLPCTAALEDAMLRSGTLIMLAIVLQVASSSGLMSI